MSRLPIPGVFAARWQKRLDRYAADKRGIAAVEFALIAMPFFFLIFGLLEVCVIFIMSSILEHAATEAARQIRTGQLQTGGLADPADKFRTDLCNELLSLLSCDADVLMLDVQTFNTFSTTGSSAVTYNDSSHATDPGGVNSDSFGFAAGGQNEIVVIRVFYEWELIVPVLSAPLSNMDGNRRLLQSTVAFRNEPFGNS